MRRTVFAVFLVLVLAVASTGVASDENEDIVDHGVGIEWVKMGMVLDVGNQGEPDSVNADAGFVMFDEGLYKMWYSAFDGCRSRTMYATSSDGFSWTKHGVVIDVGAPGEYDDEYAIFPTVLKDDTGLYKMWYTGQSSVSWGWRIMYATSDDGINWQKHGLVLSRSGKGIGHPNVLIDRFGVYRMWYSEYDKTNWRIRHAVSSDGVSWEDKGVAVDIGPPGALDSKYVYMPSVIVEPSGTYVMYYSVFNGNAHGHVDIHYASSFNGYPSTWIKKGLALSHGEGGDHDEVQATNPKITRMSDGFHMLWYTGYNGRNRRVLLAVEKPSDIEANIDCGPKTLNLRSMGNWITCFVELPQGYDPRDIDASSILLNELVRPELNPKYAFVSLEEEYITDHDADGVEERLIKFSRLQVQERLDVGHVIFLSVSGKLFNGTSFLGAFSARVIDPPERGLARSDIEVFFFIGRIFYSMEPPLPRRLT